MFYCKLSTSCQQVNQAYREKVIQFEVKRVRIITSNYAHSS